MVRGREKGEEGGDNHIVITFGEVPGGPVGNL